MQSDSLYVNGISDRGALAALGLLYGLALFSRISIALGQLCLVGLMVLLVATAWSRWNVVRRDPFLWLTVVFLVYVTLRAGFAVAERPGMAAEHLDGARRLWRSGFLPVAAVAYALARVRAPLVHVVGLLGALVVGIVISGLLDYHWADIGKEVGTRMTFGLGRISQAALALATLFLASSALAACLLAWRPRSRARAMGGTVAFLLALIALAGVIMNKTRSVWIGLMLGVICGIGYLVWIGVRERRTGARIGGAVLAGLVVLAAVLFHEPISERWGRVAPDIRSGVAALMEGDIERIEPGPIGDRIHWAVFGARLLADRPVVGYGPAESRYLLHEREDVPANIADKTTHFHNGLLDLALRLGGIGVLAVGAGAVWLLRAAFTWRRDDEDLASAYVVAFVLAWIVVLGLHQAGNHWFLDFDVTYLVALVGGTAHAGWLLAQGRGEAARG